jgi:DNA-binding PucR family transcriptional regulator
MSDPQAPASTTELVHRIVERLRAVTDAASAAEDCAKAGNTDRAFAMLQDIEPTLYEVAMMLNAVSILRGNHKR